MTAMPRLYYVALEAAAMGIQEPEQERKTKDNAVVACGRIDSGFPLLPP